MKYTIFGFSQKKLIQLKLDLKDACIIRYMVDFYSSSKMIKITEEGKEYFWINYQYLIDNIPIIEIKNKESLGRRLKNIEESGLLEKKTIKNSKGTFSFFRFIEDVLLSLLEDIHPTQKSDPTDSKVGPKD